MKPFPAVLPLLLAALPGQESRPALPPPAAALLAAPEFRASAFDEAARAVLLAAGSLEPLAAAARAAGTPAARRVLVETLRAQGRPAAALKEAEELARLAPDDPGPAALAGLLAEAVLDEAGAAAWYRRSLEARPALWPEWEARVRLALLALAGGRREEGLAELGRLARLDREALAAAAARIGALHGEKEFAGAHAGPVDSTDRNRRLLSLLQTAHLQAEGGRLQSAAAVLGEARPLAAARHERAWLAWSEMDLHRRAGRLAELAAAWQAEPSLDHERLKVLVEVLSSLGRLDQALALLARPEAAAAEAEEWVSLLLSLALEGGAEKEALAILRGRMAAHPDSLLARLDLSLALVDLGRQGEAEGLWRQALVEPRWVQPSRRLALCRRIREAGFPALARAELEALRGATGEWGLWAGLDLARLTREGGDPEGALAVLEETAEAAASHPQVLRAAGEALEELGAESQAVRVYRQVLRLTPGEDLEMRLAWLLARAGQGLEAVDLLRRIWESTSSRSRRRQAEGQLLELSAKEGILGELADRLETSLEEGKASAVEVTLLVGLYAQVGDTDSAAEVLKEFARRGGDEAGSLETLAQIHLEAGNLKEYEAVQRRLLELVPARADEWWMNLAMAALERRSPRDARLALREVAARGGTHAFRAGVLAYAGLHEEAAREYQMALAEEPEEVETWLLLGRELQAAGRSEEAIALYQYLIDRPGAEDLFVVAADGLLNLAAPPAVLAWAARRVEERLALRPTRLFYHRLLCDLLETLGQAGRAAGVLAEMVPVAAEQRGTVLRELLEAARAERKSAEVVRFGRQLMALGESFPPDVYLAVGEALIKEGAWSEAARVFARARESQDYVGLQRRVARLYLENDRSDLALRIYRRLRLVAPEDPGLLAELAGAEAAAGEASALETWGRALEMVLGRTPARSEAAAAAPRLGFRSNVNVGALDGTWEEVLQGLATVPDREGAARLLAGLLPRAEREIAGAGARLDLDRMPRLARLLDAVFHLALLTGNAGAAEKVALLVARQGREGGAEWVAGRVPALLQAGWARTALNLIQALGGRAKADWRWQAEWIAAGKPPAGPPPDLAAGLAKALWEFVFAGPEEGRASLAQALDRASPAERQRLATVAAPLRFAMGDRGAFADEIFVLLEPPRREGQPRAATAATAGGLLGRFWRLLAPADRERALVALERIAASPQEPPEWQTLWLHALLAAGSEVVPARDPAALVREVGPKVADPEERALLLRLVPADKLAATVEAMAAGHKSYSLNRFLALVPRVLGKNLDDATLELLCRLYGDSSELDNLIVYATRMGSQTPATLAPEKELRLLEVLARRAPADGFVKLARVKALARAGRIDEAIEAIRPLLGEVDEQTGLVYERDRTLRSLLAAAGAGPAEELARQAAAAGSEAAALALAQSLLERERPREARAFLAGWSEGRQPSARFLDMRLNVLRALGEYAQAGRELVEFIAATPGLQGHWQLRLAGELRAQGRFREALAAAGRYDQQAGGGVDYGALQRVRQYADLPASPERDRLILADLRRFLRPRDRNGLRSLGHQFRNLPPAILAAGQGGGKEPPKPTPVMAAAALPGALPELEGLLTLLPGVMGSRDSLWELYAAVAWGHCARGGGEGLAARVEAGLAAEPADAASLLLAAVAAAWAPEMRRSEWVRRGLAHALATGLEDALATLLWADRLALAGEGEAAARLAAVTLIAGACSNDWRSREVLRAAPALAAKGIIPEEALDTLLLAQLPLFPQGVFRQQGNIQDTSVLEEWVRAGRGARLLAVAREHAAWLEARRDPDLARHHLILAAAHAQAGEKERARELLVLALEEHLAEGGWLPLDLAAKALPADPAGLQAVAALLAGALGKEGAGRSDTAIRILGQVALALAAAGDEAGSARLWGRAVAAGGEENLALRGALGAMALEAGRREWALALLLPLARAGALSPWGAAGSLEKLLAAGAEPAALAAGFRKLFAVYRTRELALLAPRLLPREEAVAALEAALAENPADGELKAARAGL